MPALLLEVQMAADRLQSSARQELMTMPSDNWVAGRVHWMVRHYVTAGRPHSTNMHSGRTHIEVALEVGEQLADLLWFTEISHGVGDGVLIAEPQQRSQLLL